MTASTHNPLRTPLLLALLVACGIMAAVVATPMSPAAQRQLALATPIGGSAPEDGASKLVRGEVTKRRIRGLLHSGRDTLDARPATAFRAAAPRLPQSVDEHPAARSLPAAATFASPWLPLKLQLGQAP